MLALPGVCYLYTGEELGLPEADVPTAAIQDPQWFRSNGTHPSRDGARVPMPWSGDRPPYGFSPHGRRDLAAAARATGTALTVAAQTGRRGSTLELYRSALALRRTDPALAGRGCRWLPSPEGVLRLERADTRAAVLECWVNFSAEPVPLPAGEVLLRELAGAEQPALATTRRWRLAAPGLTERCTKVAPRDVSGALRRGGLVIGVTQRRVAP